VALASSETPLEIDLERAARAYDSGAAVRLLSRVRQQRAANPSLAGLQVRAGLLAAELLRIELEAAASPDRARRRLSGQRIDAFAREALELLPELPEDSERARIEADLLGTMIRSDFRARRHEGALEAAIARALELDGQNPRAWVSAAKPYLFAKPEHGGDLNEAIRLLTKALGLQPGLESARLLRAHAFDRLGDEASARRDWRQALALNPECTPAQRALAEGP
jgi:tetratricopeptide (TPR) repeat protein